MKKIGMLSWAFAFVLLLGVANAEVSKGMKLYTRTNLKTKGKKIYYHNLRSSKGFIPVGTAVKVRKVGEEYIKFKVLKNDREYSLEAPSTHFEKYFVLTREELELNDMSRKAIEQIENMNVKIGMTKAEVYISRGCPAYVGPGKKSWFYTFDQMMDSNTWYYNLSRRRIENLVRFRDGVVAAIEEPTTWIDRGKTGSHEKTVEVPVPTRQPAEPGKIRIGVLTKLGKKYFTHLGEVLEKRPDCELLKLFDPMSYEQLDSDTARTLKQKYQIDMVICDRYINQWSVGGLMVYTKLVDIYGQRLVKLDRINLGQRGFHCGWEKKVVREQIGSIDKMINEIYRERTKSKQ